MLKSEMGHTNETTTIIGTISTVILYFISRFTVTDWAGFAAIFAGIGTGTLAFYRLYKEFRKNKPK